MNPKKLAILVVFIVSAACFVGASFAASSVTQTATVTVNPVIAISGPATLNFGTVTNVLSSTPLTVTNTLNDASNQAIDVYTKANDTKMVSTTPGITDEITNIQFTPQSGSATHFTTAYQITYNNWPKLNQGGSSNNWDQVLNIEVPSYTSNGTYTVTIYNAAVAHGAGQPS